jgi:membrane protein YdbS with pleckstrin-like domain
MGISPRLLGDGERVVVSTRTHVKALLRPILVFILICGVTGFALPWVPSDLMVLSWVVLLLGAAAVAYWVVWPVLNWLSTSYTVTDRRLITRQGVLTRVGHDIPLYRVNDVFYEHGLLDRVLGCGTLIVESASERGDVVLPDVPSVERLHLSLSELLHARRPDQYDDGYDDRYDDRYDDGYDDEDSWDEPYEPETRRRR